VKVSDLLEDGTPTRLTARDVVARELRRQIVHGEIQPGEKLNPADLAERFDVSQTPAREALQLLASEGMVRNDPYRGARVSELTVEEYEELFLMRTGLEGLAARLGAERVSDEDVARMEELLAEMDQAADNGDIDRFWDRDRRFHLTHYAATERESLVRRIMNLRISSERYVRQAYVMPNVSMKDTVETHRALLDAVRARDGERCEQVITADLRRTLETFAEQFGSRSESAEHKPVAADAG
jgi:DNA-binding GntR family transcriptional regulator